MEKTVVSSSNIHSVGYESDSRILEVEFKHGGIYQYFSVPQSVYDGFMGASSHGSYFYRHVRGKYHHKKIR